MISKGIMLNKIYKAICHSVPSNINQQHLIRMLYHHSIKEKVSLPLCRAFKYCD